MNRETEMLARAIEAFGRYVDQVEPRQWGWPTPDEKWAVRDLVAHGLESVLWIPDVLAGHTIAEVGDKYDVDPSRDRMQSMWTEASKAALQAVNDYDDPTHAVHLSYGDFPARTYLQHQLIDLTIHAWDLARALGVDERLDHKLVDAAYKWFEYQAADWRSADIMGPAVPISENSDTETKLIALSGRNPSRKVYR